MEDAQPLVDAFDQALKDARPPAKPAPDLLYHYTTAGGLEGIVKTRAVRATNFSFLNDPSEVAYGRQLVLRLLNARRDATAGAAAKELLDRVILDLWQDVSEIHVACFTSLRDDLSQWRAYGGTPARYALGFRTADLFEATIRPNAHLVKFSRVVYDPQEQEEKVTLVLDAAIAFVATRAIGAAGVEPFAKRLSWRLLRMLPGLKEPAYRAETEWRVVIMIRPGVPPHLVFDTSRGVIRPYVTFPLVTEAGRPLPLDCLLVLAPAHPEGAVKAARMVLDEGGVPNTVSIRLSGIPFAE